MEKGEEKLRKMLMLVLVALVALMLATAPAHAATKNNFSNNTINANNAHLRNSCLAIECNVGFPNRFSGCCNERFFGFPVFTTGFFGFPEEEENENNVSNNVSLCNGIGNCTGGAPVSGVSVTGNTWCNFDNDRDWDDLCSNQPPGGWMVDPDPGDPWDVR